MPAVAGTRSAAGGTALLLRHELGDLRGDHRLLHPAEQVLGLRQRQAESLRLQRAALQRGDLLDDGGQRRLGLDDDLDPHAHGLPLPDSPAVLLRSRRVGSECGMGLLRTFCRRARPDGHEKPPESGESARSKTRRRRPAPTSSR